jgi:hypothetical protein
MGRRSVYKESKDLSWLCILEAAKRTKKMKPPLQSTFLDVNDSSDLTDTNYTKKGYSTLISEALVVLGADDDDVAASLV